MIKYAGHLKLHNWNVTKKRSHHDKSKNRVICNDILTFDIETTSAWVNEHGNVIRYKPGKPSEYWNELQPLALCYVWQFSVNDTVYYGRELSEFQSLLDDIPAGMECIIWVHNLAFETAFLQNIFDDIEPFARAPHKPMKFVQTSRPEIQWRCSYMLTRLSLDAWGKSLGIKKLTGQLDYEKIRTPLTPLDPEELDYCERDCIVVYHGILDYLKRYESQFDIPLTQTGTVRQVVKQKLMDIDGYNKYVKKLVPQNPKRYKLLQNIFAGGYTHANRLHAGVLQEGLIEHYDFTSHYPTMLCAMKYPCTPWVYLGRDRMPKEAMFKDNAYIMHLHFKRIESLTFNTYIQASKSFFSGCRYADKDSKSCLRCKWNHPIVDNGRVVMALDLDMWVTELDYLTIKKTYRWESMEVQEVYKSRKDYLPKELIEYVLELYHNKTALKNVEGFEDLYMQSKQYINSIFGMMVTALLQADVVFDNESKEWSILKLTPEKVAERLEELKRWFPWEKRYFVSYSWGCWCTAWARYCLWKCITSGNDRDTLYADTDSLFLLGKHDFTAYNEWITEELRKMCDHYAIDFERTRPADPKGIKRPLGVFLKEDDCIQFITLGAKRYVERRTDGKLHLTVSGINKDAVYCLHDDIRNFKEGVNFDKDFPTVNKRLLTYVTDQPEVIFPDGYRCKYKHGINLRRNGYKLTLSDEYKNLIRYEKINLASLPPSFKNNLRGRFVLNEEKRQ